MPLTKSEFETLKSHQFCDDPACKMYGLVGQGNIKTHSFASGQGYCNCCKGKPFSIRKGTMFFGLRTPIDKIIRVLSLIASGMGQNAVCRQEDVTASGTGLCWPPSRFRRSRPTCSVTWAWSRFK